MSNNTAQSNQYINRLYQQYKADPTSVDKNWTSYFKALDKTIKNFSQRVSIPTPSTIGSSNYPAIQLVENFRNYGHLIADLDPLATWIRNTQVPFLLSDFGLTHDQTVELPFDLFGKNRFVAGELLNSLRSAYSSTLAINVIHITDAQVRNWFYNQIENHKVEVSSDAKKRILEILTKSNNFERIIGSKFTGAKRFSIEGVDSMLVLLREIIDTAAHDNCTNIAIGMAHRGRLNTLVNVCGMSPGYILKSFAGEHKSDNSTSYTGDVKYHQGFTSLLRYDTKELNVHLCYNPSHLEIVGPVALGNIRAIQESSPDTAQSFKKSFAIIIHGDSAVVGQGVNQETLNLANTRGFTTGGSIHVVANNQVGFTTNLIEDVRSSIYASDIAKFTDCPIVLVNSEDPESVYRAALLAYDYRRKFNKDIFIEIIGYRRHGHNEADDPSLTQPLMYKIIRNLGTPSDNYAKKLIEQKVITQEEYYAMSAKVDADIDSNNILVPEFIEQKGYEEWKEEISEEIPTKSNLKLETIKSIATELNTIPDNISLHPRVKKIYETRLEMANDQTSVDWGFAENLAYATLLKSGISVRLTGEDVGRGTFAHRHAVIHDQKTADIFIPAKRLAASSNTKFKIWDSVLSEEAVMAFEYGYSLIHKSSLTVWEAQFGDFANTAQVVIDQFLSSGKQKWNMSSDLVLLLPHGYEGQGPEHSSARIERYLQLCAQNNMSVCVPSTPAQIYHLLRRQALRELKVPLITITPKSLLRNPAVNSPLSQLSDSYFRSVIDDRKADPSKVTKLVFLSGKLFYDIDAQRTKNSNDHVALVRVEELYPFPQEAIKKIIESYPNATQIIWSQEEPKNQGAWDFMALEFLEAYDIKLKYVGNCVMAASAVGYLDRHIANHQLIVDTVLAK